jgi:phospholipid transport system substrate-binding protein
MKLIRLLFLAFWVSAVPASSFSAAPETPAQVVENLHAALLCAMKDARKIGYEGRYSLLAPVIRETFDLPFIARIVVGKHWRTFNNEQKAKFIETFERLSIATYAYRFDGYSGEQFRLVSENGTGPGRIVVNSLLVKPDGEKIEMGYTLHRQDNRWRVINVIVDGISDLSLKRSDYTAFLARNGFDALLDKLHEKISSYSEKRRSP